MTVVEEASLFPETLNQRRTTAHSTQCPPCKATQLPEIVWTEIGQFLLFQMSPDVLGRIQLRRVTWQKLQHDPSPLRPSPPSMRSLSPDSSRKTMARPCFGAFFLLPASAPASSGGWLSHRVPRRAPQAAGNSIPVPAGCATRGRLYIELRIGVGSDRLPANWSTARFHIPGLLALASSRRRSGGGPPHSAEACALPVEPSAAPRGPRLPTAAPSGSPTADGHLLCERSRLPCNLVPKTARPSAATVLKLESPVSLQLDFPCPLL